MYESDVKIIGSKVFYKGEHVANLREIAIHTYLAKFKELLLRKDNPDGSN